MNQLKSLWQRLNNGQRLTLVGALLAVLGGIYAFTTWSRERDFKPLYTGLSAEESGHITARLKERGTEFRLNESTGAVMVPSALVGELRVELAAAGLPKTGRIGYELFDKMNFGVTEFAEQVNYHRALEGELERSMMAIQEVAAARVHLTFAKDSVFAESRQPAKASVMVRLKSGAKIPPSSVVAIQHLTASAVEGLDPAAVSVLDMKGTLLSRPIRPADPEAAAASDRALEYRQQIERDLLSKVNSTLEPLLGPEKYRAAVSAEIDLSSGESSEEVFDPNRSVMVTQQRTEDNSNPSQTAGVPGTASTLPRPASRPGGTGNSVSRRTENIAFQSSRTVKRTKTPQGVLRRLSLSILVDQAVRWEGTGAKARRILEPPTPESKKTIRDVVAGVIGFSAERGDQIIVESLPFDATLRSEPPSDPRAAPGPAPPGALVGGIPLPAWLPAPLRDPKILALAATLLLITFVGGLFAARMLLRKKSNAKVSAAEAAAAALPGGETRQSLEEAIKNGPAAGQLPPGEPRKSVDELLAQQADAMQQIEQEELAKLQLNTMSTPKSEILVKHISEQARKDAQGVAQVLRAWLQEI